MTLDLPLLLVDSEASWKDHALCAQTDPEAFFPEKGGSTREAKRVCAQCPVRARCLEAALANQEPHGVWGGMAARDRLRLIRAGRPTQAVSA